MTPVSERSFLNNKKYPRHMANNNPGAVKACNYKFKGKIKKKDRTDRSYEQFEKYYQGVLAMVEILQNYYFDFDCRTPEKLLNKYTEEIGRPAGYVMDVCKGAGFKARSPFIFNRANMNLLVSEMCRIANGRDALITSDLFAFVWLKIPLEIETEI